MWEWLHSFKSALQATGRTMHSKGVLMVMFFEVHLAGHWSYHVLQWYEDGYVLWSPHWKSLVIPCIPMVWEWLSLSSPLCRSLVIQCTINSSGVMVVTFFQVRAATYWWYQVFQWCKNGYVLSSPLCRSLVIQCSINSNGVMMVTLFQVRTASHWSYHAFQWCKNGYVL